MLLTSSAAGSNWCSSLKTALLCFGLFEVIRSFKSAYLAQPPSSENEAMRRH